MTAEWHHVLAVTYAAERSVLEAPFRGAQIGELDGSPRVGMFALGAVPALAHHPGGTP